MPLRRLQVSEFRCVQAAEMTLDPEFTLVTGQNASGKTSLLEALFFLGRGRSFRTRRLDHLIRDGASAFVVHGAVDLVQRSVSVGIEGSAEGVRAQVAGERVASLAELAATLPVQIIDPEVHRLIEEGPVQRRRFLDWGVFHVEQSFVGHWQRYQKALRQRNAALRNRQPRGSVIAWDGELLRLGTLIDDARMRYVERLTPIAADVTRALLGLDLVLAYRPGWPLHSSFEAALYGCWARDQELGTTSVGPQRAELVIRLDGALAKDRISRGQQKLLAAALLLAQVGLFPEDGPARPTMLLDDPAAELDADRLIRLIREVTRHRVQLVVTSLTSEFGAFGQPGRRYTIRDGAVREG